MFDLPDAKRVRRQDLYINSPSRSPSSSPAPEAEATLLAQLADLYGPISPLLGLVSSTIFRTTPQPSPEPKAETSYEFRLFSTAGPTKAAQTIVLAQNEAEDADGSGGFIVSARDTSYYITTPASAQTQRRFEQAAVDGEIIHDWSRRRNWGLEVPWRVKIIRQPLSKLSHAQIAQSSASTNTSTQMDDKITNRRRTKPNKKRRILLRQRLKIKSEMEEERKTSVAAKEEAEREKRTRRNREKKVKRKLKEKAKKLADGAAIGADAADGENLDGLLGEGDGSGSGE